MNGGPQVVSKASSLAPYSKFIAAFAAGMTVLASALSDGKISGAEIVEIIAAILGPIGVFAASNSNGSTNSDSSSLESSSVAGNPWPTSGLAPEPSEGPVEPAQSSQEAPDPSPGVIVRPGPRAAPSVRSRPAEHDDMTSVMDSLPKKQVSAKKRMPKK